MKIVSWNVNGIRAAHRKGLLKWFKKFKPDILCVQELKAKEDQIPDEIRQIKGYHSFYNPAYKKGYSGVGIWSKQKPLKVTTKLGFKRFDNEGRLLMLEYKNFTLLNFYIPHGDRTKKNLQFKLDSYRYIFKFLKKLKHRNLILIGDFNIAHQEIDLARPKANLNNIMFTHEERQQISDLIKTDFIDTFRYSHPKAQKYTWWPYFANARARDLGWRIDYVFISQKMKNKLKKAFILTDILGSDHCPAGIDIK